MIDLHSCTLNHSVVGQYGNKRKCLFRVITKKGKFTLKFFF